MTPSATETQSPQQQRERRLRNAKLVRSIGKPVVTMLAIAAMGRLVWTISASRAADAGTSVLAVNVLLPCAILLLVCVVAVRHEIKWTRTSRRLRTLLPGIRSGERPIDELSELADAGEIGQLIPAIQELCHDLRRQRVELALLNEEMRQKVARRTDALERAMGSLRAQASRDALTGLSNRRMLDLGVPRLIESCRAQRIDLCVLMMDVDNFKVLNDTLGHASGDQLLRDIGHLIRSTIRESDIGFRPGGDEFVIVMPACTQEAAESLAERLISLIDAHARTLHVQPKPRLSVGMARLLELSNDATADQLLHVADERLYEVKAARKSAKTPVGPPTTNAA